MSVVVSIRCFHCGEICPDPPIVLGDKQFCCSGCKSVYAILHQHELDGYYCLNDTPGQTVHESHESRFQYLDDDQLAAKIISFKNDSITQVQFYLPQIHCSSCLWLLENLHKLHEGIRSSQVNFTDKKVSITFLHKLISLRELAELLARIGYEPYISMQDYERNEQKNDHRAMAIKLGLAGFCFANIMLISFPEYLGLRFIDNPTLSGFFRYVNLFLSLPVFFYAASGFFKNAWTGIQQRFLNIDAPIALAITITFVRSVYEIVTATGAGYLDSMSGIVFFMLIGRALQEKTFTTLKFNRDYKSYFPISVTLIEDGKEISRKIQDIREGDVLKLHHQEIIPVDGILSSKTAEIDYSFVTGEIETTTIHAGDLVYAGGKIQNAGAEVIAVKLFSQNSFTELWNNKAFKETEQLHYSYVETISKYFSAVLLLIAASSFIYWQIHDPGNAWNALTAVLIVACPCTLLLASSYSNGFIIELFAGQGMFVRSVETINHLQHLDHIVLDKTGTISEIRKQDIELIATDCTEEDIERILAVVRHSSHPLSKVIARAYPQQKRDVTDWKETPGQGIEAWLDEQHLKIGKASFAGVEPVFDRKGSHVYFSIDGSKHGYFVVANLLKPGVEQLLKELKGYRISLLSGDNDASFEQMHALFPPGSTLLYNQTPQQKLDYIKGLQQKGEQVLMMGDGINDAGALKQSDVGISVVENHFSFSPASDAILNAGHTPDLCQFIGSARAVRRLIIGTFIYSLLYNIIGLSVAVSAGLQPVIAAILMPASSISVILIAWIGTRRIGNRYFSNTIHHGKV